MTLLIISGRFFSKEKKATALKLRMEKVVIHRGKAQINITLSIKLARFAKKSAYICYENMVKKACISFLPSISNLMVANSKPGLTKAKNILIFKNAILYSLVHNMTMA